jgi:predicted O-methyltransferase YrrM
LIAVRCNPAARLNPRPLAGGSLPALDGRSIANYCAAKGCRTLRFAETRAFGELRDGVADEPSSRHMAMSLAASIKKLIPTAIKQPLRNYVDEQKWRRQDKLAFDGSRLLPRSRIDVAVIMNDRAISEAFAEDHASLASIYGGHEIPGGVNPGDRRALYHLIAHFKPARILEIGTHVGASTLHIASAIRRFVEGGTLTTVDILDVNGPKGAWKSLGLPFAPAGYLSRLGLDGIVSFINRPALNALQGGPQYDFIFLDGDHSPTAVYREISASLGILNPNGVILLHDFYPGGKPLTPDGGAIRGPSMAADRISLEVDDVAFLPLGNLPWTTKAGGNATSLALVARRV